MAGQQVYSFLSILASIQGPNGNVNLGAGAANAEEGITIERSGDKNTMTGGADGTTMHSLHASNSGTIAVRLLKTSPQNALLEAMYNGQRGSSALWGQNTIRVMDVARGDVIVGRGCAFKKFPGIGYAVVGGMNEWVFDAATIDSLLGEGLPEVNV